MTPMFFPKEEIIRHMALIFQCWPLYLQLYLSPSPKHIIIDPLEAFHVGPYPGGVGGKGSPYGEWDKSTWFKEGRNCWFPIPLYNTIGKKSCG